MTSFGKSSSDTYFAIKQRYSTKHETCKAMKDEKRKEKWTFAKITHREKHKCTQN